MKYKKISDEQIVISLDRLTRFKNTKEKYLRVYTDIILANLIEPAYKKNELLNLPVVSIRDLAQEIFNASLGTGDNDFVINQKLADYENSVFNNDNETKELLNNHFNYKAALKYIPSECAVNLKWLKSLTLNQGMKDLREKYCLKFPIEKVILVEGITEEILLPAFSRYLGHDFYKNGLQVIPAGGKNQVVKMYYELAELLKIPIFVLLDKDAEDNIRQIQPRLRPQDKIHLVACGEFEDLLPKSLIVKTVNEHFENFLSITEEDLAGGISNAKKLEEIFKTKGLHEFKKADFARLVRPNITQKSDISKEIADIIFELSYGNKNVDTEICSC